MSLTLPTNYGNHAKTSNLVENWIIQLGYDEAFDQALDPDDNSINLVDDANFDGVVEGAVTWAQENGLQCYFERKILSSVIESPVHWWNGIHVMVLERDHNIKKYTSGN